jgi:hypothetical protein
VTQYNKAEVRNTPRFLDAGREHTWDHCGSHINF